MALNSEERDLIRAEVVSVLNRQHVDSAQQVERHRHFLQSQQRWLVGGIIIIVVGLAAAVAYILGETLPQRVDDVIDERVIRYRIIDKLDPVFAERVKTTIDNLAEKEREDLNDRIKILTEEAKVKLDNIVNGKISAAQSEIESLTDSLVNSAVQELGEQNSKRLDATANTVSRLVLDEMRTLLVPTGAVLAFNRETCPREWKEYVLAYGRFIRGIDKSNRGIDPDGIRDIGSIQSEQFATHSHTRPRGVYDAYGGSDASWIAHGRHLGYGHSSPPNTGTTGGSETRPDNVALLYCEKT